MKHEESRLQAHHVSHIVKHGGGPAIVVWGCMTSCGMGSHVQDRGKMTQALYFSILQDEVMKTIEWYRFNLSHVIF